MDVLAKLEQQKEEFKTWRRTIHQRPEMAFEEVHTSNYIADLLKTWGIETHQGMAKTGVIGVIQGKLGDSKRGIGIRADIDALRIHEETNVEYQSKNHGQMHACGHDGHTAMLLAATKYLAETRNFDGIVYAIFQPAEEGGGGGEIMVREGIFRKFPCEATFAIHNSPWHPAGIFAISPGPVTASTDSFEIKIIGSGGHAAYPHMTIDPLVCGAQMVTALQHIVSRTVDPADMVVLSICKFHAGTGSLNVTPETVELGGTVRTFKPELRKKVEERFRRIVNSVAEAFGARAEITWMPGYPSVVNWPKESEFARQVAVDIVGQNKIMPFSPTMGGEDFSYFLQALPGAMIVLGTGKTNNDPGLHSPHYDFNDDVLPLGAAYWVRIAETWLKK